MNNNIERPDRLWAMLSHIAALIWLPIYLISAIFLNRPLYIPFINILLPLYIWQRYKNRYHWVDIHGKESVNFQLSITLYIIISIICLLLISPSCGIDFSKVATNDRLEKFKFAYFLGTGYFLIFVISLYQTLCSITAAIQAYRGKNYRYSSTIRFLK